MTQCCFPTSSEKSLTAPVSVIASPTFIEVGVVKAPATGGDAERHMGPWSGNFVLNIEVRNLGDRPQGFESADCGWQANWSTNRPEVDLSGDIWCGRSLFRMIALAPGDSYHRELRLSASSKTPSARFVFRVAFASATLPKDK